MTNDEISQKINLLPDGLKEKNTKSWENVLFFYKRCISIAENLWLTPMVNLIQVVFESNQQNLFRAGLQLYTLIISIKEEYGLDKGDYHIRVDIDEKNSAVVWYGTNPDKSENINCSGDEIISVVQPFLDKLWNETRGKKNV